MANVITGTSLNDSLTGSYENDTITGLEGNDSLDGQAGSDWIDGGAGDDNLVGNFGNDTLYGGEGNDWLNDDQGSNWLEGGAGSDSLNSRSLTGQHTLVGGAGDDSLNATGAVLNLDGGDDNDYLNVTGQLYQGGSTSYVQDGQATLVGGQGNDNLYSSFYTASSLEGGEGNDSLNAQGGYWSNYSSYGTRPMTSTLTGGAGDDGLYAQLLSSATLEGGDGVDSLSTSSVRNASLAGGAGTDSLSVSYDGYSSSYTDGDYRADESYVLDGGEGDDTLSVSGSSVLANYGQTTATLLGGLGNDSLAAYDNNAGQGSGNGRSYGMLSASLVGGEGSDTLTVGGVLQATLTGGADADKFVLTAQQYRTQLEGARTFWDGEYITHQDEWGNSWQEQVYQTVEAGPVVITDFAAGVGGDVLDYADLLKNATLTYDGSNPFGSGYLVLEQEGADTVLKFDADGSAGEGQAVTVARLQNVVVADLRTDNFNPNFELPQLFGFSSLNDTGASATDHITRDNSFELTARTPSADHGLVFEKSTDGTNWSVTDAQQTGLADGHYEYRARMGGLKVEQQGAIRVEQTQDANGELTLRFFADGSLGNIHSLDFTVSYDAARATLVSATPGAGFDLGDANESAPGQVMVALASDAGYATGGATPLAELHLQLGAGVGTLSLGVGSVVVDEVARDGSQLLLVPELVTAPIEVTVDTGAPVISSAAEVAVQEGQNQLYDANTGDANVTWGLSGADAQLLQIDANGVVTLREGVLDTDGANAKASYKFNVEATDLAGNTGVQGVSVGVENIADTLQGMVYHWKTHALVSDVSLAVSAAQPVEGAGYALHPLADARTAGNGQYGMITGLPGGLLAVEASKSLGEGETGGVVNAADALAALKLSVGKNLYADPDGGGPLQAQTASPYQYIAADVNDDGQVTAADALAILKMAVKRGDAVPREWLFVSEQTDFWSESANGGAGAYATNAGQVQWDRDAALVSGQETLNLVAVLKGDVNGSWAAPVASAVVADSHFEQLVLNGVGPMEQWGLLTV